MSTSNVSPSLIEVTLPVHTWQVGPVPSGRHGPRFACAVAGTSASSSVKRMVSRGVTRLWNTLAAKTDRFQPSAGTLGLEARAEVGHVRAAPALTADWSALRDPQADLVEARVEDVRAMTRAVHPRVDDARGGRVVPAAPGDVLAERVAAVRAAQVVRRADAPDEVAVGEVVVSRHVVRVALGGDVEVPVVAQLLEAVRTPLLVEEAERGPGGLLLADVVGIPVLPRTARAGLARRDERHGKSRGRGGDADAVVGDHGPCLVAPHLSLTRLAGPHTSGHAGAWLSLVRAPRLGRGGRRFESARPD